MTRSDPREFQQRQSERARKARRPLQEQPRPGEGIHVDIGPDHPHAGTLQDRIDDTRHDGVLDPHGRLADTPLPRAATSANTDDDDDMTESERNRDKEAIAIKESLNKYYQNQQPTEEAQEQEIEEITKFESELNHEEQISLETQDALIKTLFDKYGKDKIKDALKKLYYRHEDRWAKRGAIKKLSPISRELGISESTTGKAVIGAGKTLDVEAANRLLTPEILQGLKEGASHIIQTYPPEAYEYVNLGNSLFPLGVAIETKLGREITHVAISAVKPDEHPIPILNGANRLPEKIDPDRNQKIEKLISYLTLHIPETPIDGKKTVLMDYTTGILNTPQLIRNTLIFRDVLRAVEKYSVQGGGTIPEGTIDEEIKRAQERYVIAYAGTLSPGLEVANASAINMGGSTDELNKVFGHEELKKQAVLTMGDKHPLSNIVEGVPAPEAARANMTPVREYLKKKLSDD